MMKNDIGRDASGVEPETLIPLQVTRLPAPSFPIDPNAPRTTYHIYKHKEMNMQVTRTLNFGKESHWSSAKREIKKSQQEAKKKGILIEDNKKTRKEAFYLHTPCLAFHKPPNILYSGPDESVGHPVVLIHGNGFWTTYKLQYGKALAEDGVIDPRGVVSWKHNGGEKWDLRNDDKRLKGYKVRNWRLIGETGKEYVKDVIEKRKAGIRSDPDVVDLDAVERAKADGVVYLKWQSPFSRQTRQYHFSFGGMEFYWKGTGAVKKNKWCGMFVRYNHLKLIVCIPNTAKEPEEVCLALYKSTVTGEKCGRLELFDAAILSLYEGYVEPREASKLENVYKRMGLMKRSALYRIIMATALCMIGAEKEKRKLLGMILLAVAEGGAGAAN
ncbi:hypothetical protein P280DRAFT_548122 [Massarina eburnea CBS 473.64]|uniref:Uncharacterized protein n=1 Tax=Massarina eburnea CBS 473.64 TaxID=1395130 RepID=A0A6A6S4P6_9PLEO|nr:hypothetical protein P280DRAFT_548122 [Massarina eburnea CBS 473.64]